MHSERGARLHRRLEQCHTPVPEKFEVNLNVSGPHRIPEQKHNRESCAHPRSLKSASWAQPYSSVALPQVLRQHMDILQAQLSALLTQQAPQPSLPSAGAASSSTPAGVPVVGDAESAPTTEADAAATAPPQEAGLVPGPGAAPSAASTAAGTSVGTAGSFPAAEAPSSAGPGVRAEPEEETNEQEMRRRRLQRFVGSDGSS